MKKVQDFSEKLIYERKALAAGCTLVAGTDEVGRGPLAGPVVCCAVILPLGEEDLVLGVDDSKKVSAKKREALAEILQKKAISCAICEVSPEEIDRVNILNATKNCMKTCVERLSPRPDLLLVDAVDTTFCVPHESIIKGDAKSYLVGAASIIAKVYRDRLMDEYDALYPAYNFKKNKGYGTKEHIDAIREVGPCPIHRKTFIKNFWDEEANAPRKSS